MSVAVMSPKVDPRSPAAGMGAGVKPSVTNICLYLTDRLNTIPTASWPTTVKDWLYAQPTLTSGQNCPAAVSGFFARVLAVQLPSPLTPNWEADESNGFPRTDFMTLGAADSLGVQLQRLIDAGAYEPPSSTDFVALAKIWYQARCNLVATWPPAVATFFPAGGSPGGTNAPAEVSGVLIEVLIETVLDYPSPASILNYIAVV